MGLSGSALMASFHFSETNSDTKATLSPRITYNPNGTRSTLSSRLYKRS